MPRRLTQRASEGADLDPSKVSPSTFTDGHPLPKVLIFDLDYTLWPFWVDTHVTPPLKASSNNAGAIDRTGDSFTFYQYVPSILYAAHAQSIPLGLASRTHTPDLATKMLSLIQIPAPATQDMTRPKAPKKAIEFFQYKQIFPGDKRTHMQRIKKESEIAYEDMLFFDDEIRNSNVESLGVTFRLVRDGVTIQEVDEGIKDWRNKRGFGQDSSTRHEE